MNAIFASKLYKTSTRKNKIASALQNPINTELVKQLKSYLDEPEDVTDALEEKDIQTEKDTERFQNDSETKVEKKPVAKSQQKPESVPSELTKFHPIAEDDSEGTADENSEENSSNEDESDKDKSNEDKSNEDKSDSEVKENKRVQGATVLYTPSVQASCCDQVRIDAEILKGTLNGREDTAGVSRVNVKDEELWIYYQDKVNLNSIMEPVISLMNAADFAHLEFNRLARSSNAIVFDISCIPNEVETIDEVK